MRRQLPLGKVLTFAPIFPLEGGLDIYPDFAAGPFTWRSAPLMDASERQRLGILSHSQLERLLTTNPPSGILVGYEPDLEAPFIKYAQDHGFTPITLPDGNTLWTPSP